MAERGGFEPSVELPPHLISSQAHSSTLSSLQTRYMEHYFFVFFKKNISFYMSVKFCNFKFVSFVSHACLLHSNFRLTLAFRCFYALLKNVFVSYIKPCLHLFFKGYTSKSKLHGPQI